MQHKDFTLIKKEFLTDINSNAYLYEHNITKARIVFFDNTEQEKVFSIGFQTLPYDDNGVAHILEHSVLAGSKKYPLKDPFFQLVKGSLQTFLNAMTYPDKTIYPIASMNNKDFHNLVDIYLDSVFNPLLKEEIFSQEGWHYDFKNDTLSYQGIVFNEMKGAYSPPEHYMSYIIDKHLYATGIYSHSSGGYPKHIPSLSYEKLKEYHKQNYHPSNSISFFYGENNQKYWLDYLQNNYFSSYSYTKPSPKIQPIKKWNTPKELHETYPDSEKNSQDKNLLTINFLLENYSLEHVFEGHIINNILLGNPSSILYKKLQDSNLGKSIIDDGFSDYGKQTSFCVGLRGVKKNKLNEFKKVFFQAIEELINNGIDPSLIQIALNKYDFSIRELDNGSTPKGLKLFCKMMGANLYGETEFAPFHFNNHVKVLKDKIEKNPRYLEELIEKLFLKNSHYLLLELRASHEKFIQLQKDLSQQLAQKQQSLSKQELQTIIEKKSALEKFQNMPDSEELISLLPSLTKQDLTKEVSPIPTKEKLLNQNTIYFHELFCNGLSYINLFFNINHFDITTLQYTQLFAFLFDELGTKNKNIEELQNSLELHTGDYNFSIEIFSNEIETNRYFNIDLSINDKKYNESFEIIADLIHNIKLSDKEKIKQLLISYQSRLYNQILSSAHNISTKLVQQSLSITGTIQEKISGLSYYQFISTIVENFDSQYEQLLEQLNYVSKNIFFKNNLEINLTATQTTQLEQSISIITKNLNNNPKLKTAPISLLEKQKIAIASNSSVQYVSFGTSLIKYTELIKGDFNLLKRALTTIHLLENIRLKGGAYGCFCHYNEDDHSLIFTSYRDPELTKTLEVFKNSANFIKNLNISPIEFEQLLIGSVGGLDKPLSPKSQGYKAFTMMKRSISWEQKQLERTQLIETDINKIRNYYLLLEEFIKGANFGIFGNKTTIIENKKLFDIIHEI